MIESEEKEIEELLKNKISWKSILKGILAFIFMGTAYVFINFFSDFSLVGFILLCLSSVLMIPQIKQEEKNRLTISISVCENAKCGKNRVQDYEPGDFVFKISGSCSNCGGNFRIKEIYSVKLMEKKKRSKKQISKINQSS